MAEELQSHASHLGEPWDAYRGSEMVKIVAQNFGEAWQPMLQQEWEEGIVSDMILKVGSKNFKVHRLVMLIHSSNLQQRIRLADSKKTPLEVSLDMDAVLVEKALEYMYQGQTEVARAQLQPLTDLAQNLGITSLRKLLMIEQQLRNEVTINNCLSIWDAGAESGHKELAQEAKALALENYSSLQHTAEFEALSVKIVLEYLTSDALVTERPEERFLAALNWVRVDPTARHKHLCPILDSLPLDEMGWFLGHALKLPLIKDSGEARGKIQQANKRIASGRPTERDHITPHIPRPEAPVGKGEESHHYLVLTGHEKGGRHTNEVVAVNLNKNFECISLGHISAEFDEWTNCCIQGGSLFVSCLGSDKDELCRFKLQDKSSMLQTRLRTPRQCHGMISHHTGHLYIIGGYDPRKKCSTDTVEDIAPDKGTDPLEIGHLKHSILIYNNLRIVEVDGGDLAVVGARDSQGDTTLQLWSPLTGSTKTYISFSREMTFVNGAVHADGHIIVVGYETIVCKILNEGQQNNYSVSDNYSPPSQGCAVVLTPQNYILLVGGNKVPHVFRARVDDVINNTEQGWQPVDNEFTLQGYYIYGYDTTNLPLQA